MEQGTPHNTPVLPEEADGQEIDHAYRAYKPLGVILLIALSLILFLGINLQTGPPSWDVYRRWGYLPGEDIWNGQLWGLLSSNFVHLELWHIAANLYWLWQLGKKVEYEKRFFRFFFIALTTGLISSIYQLAFSDETGIGLSGIVYGLFGYLLVQGRYQEQFRGHLTQKTICFFLVWLVLCFVLTYAGELNAGNAGHVSGLVWGGILAAGEHTLKGRLKAAVPAGLLLLSLLSVAWAPWSLGWLRNKAYNLHQANQLTEALVRYDQILARDASDAFARENKKSIQVYQLSQAAQRAHQEQDVQKARRLYGQLLAVDPQNQWAKENLEKLTKQLPSP